MKRVNMKIIPIHRQSCYWAYLSSSVWFTGSGCQFDTPAMNLNILLNKRFQHSTLSCFVNTARVLWSAFKVTMGYDNLVGCWTLSIYRVAQLYILWSAESLVSGLFAFHCCASRWPRWNCSNYVIEHKITYYWYHRSKPRIQVLGELFGTSAKVMFMSMLNSSLHYVTSYGEDNGSTLKHLNQKDINSCIKCFSLNMLIFRTSKRSVYLKFPLT